MIESQPEGNDIHGLVKNVAYLIYIKGVETWKRNSPASDWARAVDYVLASSQESGYPPLGNPELYHRTLEMEVQTIRKKEGCDEKTAWSKAQHKSAKQVFDFMEGKKEI